MNERIDNSLWVFGYGSLCWNPGFTYGQSIVGSIRGFARRFWQGNTTHRGIPGKPGRVATLVEDADTMTYGVAFQLLGEDALNYLNQREVQLGGYVSHITLFQPIDLTLPSFPVLLYVATPSNEHWMGPEKLESIAEQVVNSSGNSGYNVEYVLRLANWMRDVLPDVVDGHLYTLELHIKSIITERKFCLKAMMKNEKCCTRLPETGDKYTVIGKKEKESKDEILSDNASNSKI